MRFFSNDAREADDELALDDRPDRVQSDPVAVPNQRPPSPWSNTPSAGDGDRETADDEPRDRTADPAADAVDDPADDDKTAGPGDRTTAFGVASPQENRWGAVPDADTPYAGSAAVTAPADTRLDDEDRVDAHDHGGPADDVDVPLDEPAAGEKSEEDEDAEEARARSDEGDPDAVGSESAEEEDEDEDDGPEAVGTATDAAGDDVPADSETAVDDTDEPADEDRPGEPAAVAPVTDAPLAADDTPAADETPATDEPATDDTAAADTVAAAAAVPVAVGAAATGAAAKTETIFGADDAKSFQERWREVQLRFVDSPKDAAAEATTLIDEAVDKLTAGLKAQRDELIDDTEDTERLRLQLRGYRDILNRILSL